MITWRRVVEADFPLLRHWLEEPRVARWWNHETSVEAVTRDFGPGTRGEEPSVVQVRSEDVSPEAIGEAVVAALRQMSESLDEGALLTVEPTRMRLRLLPLRPR